MEAPTITDRRVNASATYRCRARHFLDDVGCVPFLGVMFYVRILFKVNADCFEQLYIITSGGLYGLVRS